MAKVSNVANDITNMIWKLPLIVSVDFVLISKLRILSYFKLFVSRSYIQ